MKLSTLCYLEQNGRYLMMHRVRKKNDINKGKWIGVGGKFEKNESPEECMLREVKEETGYTLKSFRFRGIVTFVSDEAETEYMFLFTSSSFTGDYVPCEEGDLEWVEKESILDLELWEGDRIFLRLLMENKGLFFLKLCYEGEKLASTKLTELS